MTILSLYFPIFLSLSISFLLHTFKKHVHSFLHFATTFITTNKETNNNKLHLKCYHPISSTTTTHANKFLNPSTIGYVDDIGGGDGFMSCTESLGFESIDETCDQMDKIDYEDDDDDDDDNNNNNMDEGEDSCWRMRVEEGRGIFKEMKSFPPPLSPSFVLLPVRENGRLQLRKVRIRRPEVLYASREDGRLRLYLVPDQCIDDEEEEECEVEEEEEQQEPVEEEQPEEEIKVESEEEEEEVIEEIRWEYEKDQHRFGEWKFPIGGNIERFRRCHDVVNQSYHVHGSHHHHLYMCIA